MIKEVNYYPQYLIEQTQFNENYAVISITDSALDNDGIAKIVGTNNILRLHFLDIEDKSSNSQYSHFTEDLAQKTITFINNLHNEDKCYNLAIHCRMGASRSPAIALYVHQLTKCDFPGYEMANTPNKLVLSTLEKLSGLKIVVPEKTDNDNIIILIPTIKIK